MLACLKNERQICVVVLKHTFSKIKQKMRKTTKSDKEKMTMIIIIIRNIKRIKSV